MLISTERLVIRPAQKDDATFVALIWNNPEIMAHVGYPEGLSVSGLCIEKRIENISGKDLLNKILIVQHCETGCRIGQAYITVSDRSEGSITDIKLLPEHQGLRYGIEIKKALVNHLFENGMCQYVEATPNIHNVASIRMQESVGAIRIGRGRFKPPHTPAYSVKDIDYWIYRLYRGKAPFADCRTRSFCYSAIIPAAGRSQRMNSFKPLLPWPPGHSTSRYTVIENTVQNVMNAGVSPIVVTTGFRSEDVQSALAGWPVEYAENRDYTEPMISSIMEALPCIRPSSAVLVLPGDHPAVNPDTIQCLIAFHEDESDCIHIPVWKNKRGHPALFPPGLLHNCSEKDLKYGLRSVIHSGTRRVACHTFNDAGICTNLDYPADYYMLEI